MNRHRGWAAAAAAAAAAAVGVVAGLVAPGPAVGQPATGTPVLALDPAGVTSVQAPDQVATRELTIGNAGIAGDLAWQVFEGAPRPRPAGPATVVPAAGDPVGEGSGSLASYRGFAGRPGWTVTPPVPEPPEGAVAITHSDSYGVTAGSSVACSPDGGITTDRTGYLRHFTLTDFDIVGGFEVTAVSFGVESLRGGPQPPTVNLTVNLHLLADPAAPLDDGNLDPIGTATATLPARRMAIVEVPVSGTVPAGATLVVEVEAPDMSRGGLFIGANPAGQTAPSYLRAPACGIDSPVPVAELGFPDMHIAMGVTGVPEIASCDVPTGTPWLDLAPRSGTVAPGAEQVVAVSFDSAGRTVGDVLTADLCLRSDDPGRPVVEVPVTLTVVHPSGVGCDRTITGVHPGPLAVTGGVTCLAPGARVEGEVNVLDGAGLVATGATIQGPVATFGATIVDLSVTGVTGPVAVRGTTGLVSLTGNQIIGSVLLTTNHTADHPILVSGNTVVGSLFCTGNQPAPVDGGIPNTVTAAKLDQCAGL